VATPSLLKIVGQTKFNNAYGIYNVFLGIGFWVFDYFKKLKILKIKKFKPIRKLKGWALHSRLHLGQVRHPSNVLRHWHFSGLVGLNQLYCFSSRSQAKS
jgi:hypothetical protein